MQGPVHDVSFYSMTEAHGVCGIAGLIEIDAWTSQPYQPWLNHRGLDVKSYKFPTRRDDGTLQPPMIQSIVKPDRTSLFVNGDAISCAIYQIEAVDDFVMSEDIPLSCRLKAGRNFSLKDEDGKQQTGGSTIRNRRVVPVTAVAVKRFLKFWNFKWVKKGKMHGEVGDDEPVTLQVLASLVKLLDLRLTTENDFKEMLKEFQFDEKLYRCDEKIDLEGNRRQFFALMKAFVPLRLGVFDGKHRMFGMMNISYGVYDICNEIKEGTPYEIFETKDDDYDFAGVPKKNVKYDGMQCFLSQQILIGKAVHKDLTDVQDLDEQFSVFRSYGHTKTAAAKQTIKEDWMSLCIDFLDYAEQTGQLRELNLLDFSVYWQKALTADSVVSNGERIADMIEQYAASRNKTDAFLSSGTRDWEKVKRKIREVLTRHSYPWGVLKNPKFGGISDLIKVSSLQPIVTKFCKSQWSN